jgi:hypothetical protein
MRLMGLQTLVEVAVVVDQLAQVAGNLEVLVS